mgnify:CR=1 FL=1
MKILYALDLDGVIIDSIEECYINSSLTFHGKKTVNKAEKDLFYKYRGEVGPAFEYYFLMFAINSGLDIKKNMRKMISKGLIEEAKEFEFKFFENRNKIIANDFKSWIKLNPLTDFGLFLKKKKPKNVIIVTTKNNFAAKRIISFYNIEVQKVYGNEELEPYGSKGALLNHLMLNSTLDEIVFIDDSIKHLETVKNRGISCYFADWGYEKYQECDKYPLATIDLFNSYVNSKK